MAIKLLKDLKSKRMALCEGDVVETGGCNNFTCAKCGGVTCWGQDTQTWTPLVNYKIDTFMESAGPRGILRSYNGECPHCGQKYAKSAWLSKGYLGKEGAA